MTRREGITVCAGCGCDDLHACEGGCSWLAADHQAGSGVCSNCGHALTAWRHQRAQVGQRDTQTAELTQVGPTDI
jgi:hypothetical protein